MKSVTVLFMLLCSSTTYSQQGDALSDIDPAQAGLELENQNMYIQDLEAERKTSREEAIRTEKEAADTRKKLEQLQVKTKTVEGKAQQDISIYEARRKQADVQQKKDNGEIAVLTKHINQLEQEVAQKKAEMKNAEDLAATGKEELTQARARRTQLLASRKKAVEGAVKANANVKKMKHEYLQIVQGDNEQPRKPDGKFIVSKNHKPVPNLSASRQGDNKYLSNATATRAPSKTDKSEF